MHEAEWLNVVTIDQFDSLYPSCLTDYLAHLAPVRLGALGNLVLLQRNKLALSCSLRCPGDLILNTYDLARQLRSAGTTVIGGFHSPMERECVRILLRGAQPIVLCPGRSVFTMRLRPEHRRALQEGRLLVLSPLEEKQSRMTAETALYRNEFVAALADGVFVAYAERQGKTEHFCREILAWGKPIYTFASEANRSLIDGGVRPLGPNDILG